MFAKPSIQSMTTYKHSPDQPCVAGTTEYTEWQWPISGLHSIIMVKSEDGGCTLSPFHSIYHREQSCGVRSNWQNRYTAPIFPLPLHVLYGWTRHRLSPLLYFSSFALASFRKQFPGSQAAFWMIVKVIGSYLKAGTSLVKRVMLDFHN